MKGTSFSQMEEMDLTPPYMTTRPEPAITVDTTRGSTGKLSQTTPVMAEVCTAPPMPRMARPAKMAKVMAMALANQGTEPSGRRKRSSQMYMAPPIIWPLAFFTRYFTDAKTSVYLVAMPRMPVIHIQNTAPGPPEMMAVATPMIEPVPKVDARAVIMAANWLTSPGELGSLVMDRRRARGSLRWMNPVRTVV